jgi:hypothetical protein
MLINKDILKKLAEREGFEPSKRLTPLTRFPSVRVQPLCHLSKIISYKIHVNAYMFLRTNRKTAFKNSS